MKLSLKVAHPIHKRGWKDGDPEIFEIPDGAIIISATVAGYGSLGSYIFYAEPVNQKHLEEKRRRL